jgi:hypothetical protein
MIEESRLPEALKLRAGNCYRFMAGRLEGFAQTLFQSAFLSAQGDVVPDADKNVNMIGHQNITSGSDVKRKSAPGIFPEGLMHSRAREQGASQQHVERNQIERRRVLLKDNGQPGWRVFDFAVHNCVAL